MGISGNKNEFSRCILECVRMTLARSDKDFPKARYLLFFGIILPRGLIATNFIEVDFVN